MTDAGWFDDLLAEEWGNPDDDPLSTELNMPRIVTEGDNQDRRRAVQADEPYIFATDGGNPVINPRSVGYREEYVEAILSIDVETNINREHLVGTVEDDYGGLAGEIKRIADKYRNGMRGDGSDPVPDPGFDLIIFDTYEDEVGQRGADRWGGVWTLTFITFAAKIPQQPVR